MIMMMMMMNNQSTFATKTCASASYLEGFLNSSEVGEFVVCAGE